MNPAPALLIVGWLILHIGALIAAWGTRVAAGSRAEGLAQLACFTAMAAVGSVAWFVHSFESGLSVLSGVVLVVMVLTAVVDLSRPQDVHSVLHSMPQS